MTTTLLDMAKAIVRTPLSEADDTPEGEPAAIHNFGLLRRDQMPGQHAVQQCACDEPNIECYWMNPRTGAHGWMCSECLGLTQMG